MENLLGSVNRRRFLSSSTLALAAGCVTRPASSPVAIIDTHTHFYDPGRPEGVPWPPRNDAVLYRAVLPAELKSIAEPLGVRGTVVVEASPRVEDNAWILGLAASDPFLLGLVGHLKPGTPGFASDLDRFARNKLFRGIRTGGWDIPVAPENSGFVRDLARLGQRGLALDVLGGPDSLPKIGRLARALPELQMVINHCAGVRIDGRAPDPLWTDGIREVAAHPNVAMKVSGLAEGTGREFSAPSDVDFYRPVLDLLWNAFGGNRLIFGSNWPVSARFAGYKEVLGIVQPYFREKGRTAEAKYFHRNAQRIYGVHI
jgi:L-fuconolactonase